VARDNRVRALISAAERSMLIGNASRLA